MNGYLSICKQTVSNRSLLILTNNFCPRICRAQLHVSRNTCHFLNLFSTTPQYGQESKFPLRKNSMYRNVPRICSSSKYNINHQSVRFFNEFENDEKKKPVAFSTPEDRIRGGKYSTENILMPETFPEYIFPNLTSLAENLLAQLKVRKLDKELTIPNFLDAAKKAVIVVANLLSTNNVDAIEDLTTSKAFHQIKANYPKIPATHLKQLVMDEDKYLTPVRHIHRILIKPKAPGPSGEEKKVLQIVLMFEGYEAQTAGETPTVFVNLRGRRKIACTASFEREYYRVDQRWESYAAWKISGICYITQDKIGDKLEMFVI